MKTLKSVLVLVLMSVLGLSATGCMKGPKGDPGEPGKSGRIISSVICYGTIPGGYGDLTGIQVDFSAVLTELGDVYATGAVIYDGFQSASTAFYAAAQPEALSPEVRIVDDVLYVNANLHGVWTLKYLSNTSQLHVKYEDKDYAAPHYSSLTFPAANCSVKHW